MQIMPRWHQEQDTRHRGEPSLMLIAPNIAVGAAIMAEYLDAEDGDIKMRWVHYLGTTGAETICEKGESRDGAPDASAEGDLTRYSCAPHRRRPGEDPRSTPNQF